MITENKKYPDNKKIVVLVKENPKRPKTHVSKMFDLYKKAKNIGELAAAYEAAGWTRRFLYNNLDWDVKHEFVKVA